jgi:hypothetical protein
MLVVSYIVLHWSYVGNPIFSKHLIENQHPFSTIKNTMEILYTTGKVSRVNTIKKLYTYEKTKNNNQFNDQNTLEHNSIFKALSQLKQ